MATHRSPRSGTAQIATRRPARHPDWRRCAGLAGLMPMTQRRASARVLCQARRRHWPHGVYTMRMARVNITIPDDLLNQAKAAGLNVSRLAAAALAEELDRRAKINELDAYLADLDNELGPVPQHELKAARDW